MPGAVTGEMEETVYIRNLDFMLFYRIATLCINVEQLDFDPQRSRPARYHGHCKSFTATYQLVVLQVVPLSVETEIFRSTIVRGHHAAERCRHISGFRS